MRRRHWTWVLTGAASLAILGAAASAPAVTADEVAIDPDQVAVRAALQPYLAGHASGRGDVMATAFTDGARLSSVVDGRLFVRDAKDYFLGFPGAPAEDEGERRRWIQSIEVVGDMAIARVILLYPGVRFVDYMVLHRVADDWKVVHKAYHAEPR
jgi:hypothetical protein